MRYLSYDLSLKAKNKSFNAACFGYYLTKEDHKPTGLGKMWTNSELIEYVHDIRHSGCCTAPTHQGICDWLRVRHNIDILVPKVLLSKHPNYLKYNYLIVVNNNLKLASLNDNADFDYYVVWNKAIEKALDMID